MTLTAPLVIEKVWLDKPKYDAAERRYYERLTKSLVSSKTEVGPSPTNSNVCPKPQLTDDNVITETNVEENELSSSLSSVASTNDSKLSENLKDVCTRPTEGNVSAKSNSTSAKKKSEPSTPEIKDDKQEIQTPPLTKKEEPNVCSLPAKAEKQKKSVSPPQKGPKMESLPKKTDTEDVCSKAKSNTKDHKQLPLQSNPKIEANITEQISEVAKLKGYFLQSKPRITFPQSDRSLTKGTNVNTIPEISKLNQCPEKIKANNNVKKVNQINQQLPITDKHETTQLIIPKDNISEHAVEEQVKNDSKKRKRNKKVRSFKRDVTQNPNSWNSLAGEVAKARQHIKNSLQCIDDIAVTSNTVSVEVTNRIVLLEKENQELTSRMEKMEERIVALEKALQAAATAAAATASRPVEKAAPAPKQPAPQQNNDDDDDGVDLFGSDSEEEDTEAARIKEQRLAEYAARKAKKPALIAKSNIILDVKPWDDETDMKLMEAEVRKIQTDGLVWGASKLVPLAYGICKLQISCVVEDEKVSVDWLTETIQEIEDYVQSVDIAAFNKV